jgi:hypothetical protein
MYENVRGAVRVIQNQVVRVGYKGDDLPGRADYGRKAVAIPLASACRNADPACLACLAIVDEHIANPVAIAHHEIGCVGLECDEPSIAT